MHRTVYLVTAVFLATLLFIPLTQSVHTAADSGPLRPLTDLPSYSQWFEQQTGHIHDPTYFGAYALLPISDTLYIGFGAGRPADVDGALLARSDGVTVTAVSTLTEQGFIGMAAGAGALSDTLFIPGVDPCCTDGWELGNTYVYTPANAAFAKFRNLPDVIHSWGLWADASAGALYTAVSFSPDGGDGGGVFRSSTQAQTWTKIADSAGGVGQNRTYDIIGLQDKRYVTWNDGAEDGPCGLAVSEDDGQSWSRLPGLSTMCRPRLAVFQDQLLALRDDRAALYAVTVSGTPALSNVEVAVTHTLPFSVTDWAYNYLTTDNVGNLYVVADDGRIMHTTDLNTWDTAATTNLDLITITYWPAKNWLVVGDRGSAARLWYLDLAPPPTAQYVILMIADGWGANQIAAANAYSGAAPAYQSWTQTWMSTFPAAGSYDPSLAWTDFNYVLNGTTESAAAATAMYTGVKTGNGRIAVNESATERLPTISEQARALGWAAGAVSSVPISHATPGAWMGHNDFRLNGYAIADEGLWGDPNTTGAADSAWYGGGHGPTWPPLDVVIGGGHPNWSVNNYVNSAIGDKLAAESGQPGAFIFTERLADSPDGGERLLATANLTTTTRLVGLFGGVGGSLEYRLADGSGHDPENPTLAQMTTAALTVLGRSPEGFVLMVEGGAVDWAGHANNMDQMIGELIGFNNAVQAVIDWVNDPENGSSWDNTLVIVTGDHETGYLTAGPAVFPDQPLGIVNSSTLGLEKTVASTGRRASWDDNNGNNEIDVGETVYWAWNSTNHSNSLIPLYAQGAGAGLVADYVVGLDPVRGEYVDNTAVYPIMHAVIQTKLYLPLIARP
jgi:alkaline phosphatase